ncbi:MAG: ribosome-associated translation inhibitor RaiA [Planctomycetes bacterium]|nr:ribosome-associated translation inhibitor RaiA [Planctomycetota bacterium]
MQVAITCRHGTIRDEVRDQIRAKAERLLTYFERVTAIEVTINFENDQITVEIVLDAEHKRNFVARDTGTDVLGSFDRALHKMEPQLKRYKQKIQDHRRDRSLNELAAGEPPEAEDEELDEE